MLQFNDDGGIMTCVVKIYRRATICQKIKKMKCRKLFGQSQLWNIVPELIEEETALSVEKDATGITKESDSWWGVGGEL